MHTAALPAQPRRRRPAIRRCADDHRRRLGQRRRGRPGWHGVEHVDAVEIEPVLNEIGRETIPNRPYDDPRVSIHLDDGRSFVRKTASVRPDRLRPGRFAGAALGLFEPAPGELPVHRGGVSRHQGQAQARRRVRHVQLSTARAGSSAGWRRWSRRFSGPSRS